MQPRYILLVAVVISVFPLAAYGDAVQSVYLQVAAHKISGEPASCVQNGLLWGPVDAVVRCLGADVNWQPEIDLLVATTAEGREFRFEAGHIMFRRDGQLVPLPAPMTVVDGMLVAPLAQIIEALDGKLSSNEELTHFYVTVPMAEPIVRADEKGLAVELKTTGLVTGEVKYLDEPHRAFLDISGAAPHSVAGKRYIGQNGIWRLRWGQFASRPAIARYVLDLQAEQEVVWLPRADGRGGSLIVGRFDGDEPELPVRFPELASTQIHQRADDATVVELALSLPVELDYDVLSQPWRVRVKLKDAQTGGKLLRQRASGGIVRALEAIPTDDGVKVDIYLNQLIGFELCTRTTGRGSEVKLTFSKAQLCDQLIMIDPGHGGEDTGARGQNLVEKEINLDVATQVVHKLIAEDCLAMLTRDGDVAVDLFDRPRLGQQVGVDAFVSIHCNAMPQRDTNWGTETYYYTPQSKMLAVIIHQELLRALGRKDNGVRRARFVVIRETEIPSVLIELMYLNHRDEEKLLAQPEVRAAAAQAIVRGLRQYYEGQGKPQPDAQEPASGDVQLLDDSTNGGE